jgi:DNA-binding transcriptional ArsR family regulator
LADFDNVAVFLTALANEKRLLILDQLLKQEMSVGALARFANISQSALSQHLAKLRALELVSTRRDAQTIYYAVSSARIRPMMMALSNLYPRETASNTEAAASN